MNVVSCCAFYIFLMALIMVKTLEVTVFFPFNGLFLSFPWVGVSGDLTNRPTLFSSTVWLGCSPCCLWHSSPCKQCCSLVDTLIWSDTLMRSSVECCWVLCLIPFCSFIHCNITYLILVKSKITFIDYFTKIGPCFHEMVMYRCPQC